MYVISTDAVHVDTYSSSNHTAEEFPKRLYLRS